MIDFIFETDFLERQFMNVPLSDIFFSIGIFFIFLLVIYIIKDFLLNKLRDYTSKTRRQIDSVLVKMLQKVHTPFLIYLAFYLSSFNLPITGFFRQVLDVVFIIWVVVEAIFAFQILVQYVINRKMAKEEDENTKSAVELIGKIIMVGLWGMGILLVLSNLGINITSLIAGLGIGGIAIALALQNVLGDLFSSFAIYFDKPFKVGDFIIIGDKMGIVQKIGIKTTRLRALQGEEIIIPNQELSSARIQNFKRMEKRRIVFSFGVLYETPVPKLKKIPGMVKKIITEIKDADFDRAHFQKFDDSSLTFEVVYIVKTADYNKYMDIQQKINIELMSVFVKENIQIAYPTRTLYMHNIHK